MNKVIEAANKNEVLVNINKLINKSHFLSCVARMNVEFKENFLEFNYDEPTNELDYRYMKKFWRDVNKLIKSK